VLQAQVRLDGSVRAPSTWMRPWEEIPTTLPAIVDRPPGGLLVDGKALRVSGP